MGRGLAGVVPPRVLRLGVAGISWKLSSGLEGSGTAASAVFFDH